MVRGMRVTTFPEFLYEDLGYALWKILKVLGLAPSPFSVSHQYDICVNFEDTTFGALDMPAFMARIHDAQQRPMPALGLNYSLTDISKRRVGEVFAAVFGYALNVDPRSFEGMAVQKSDLNAKHDGKVIACPIAAGAYRQAMSYTRLVDNTDGEFVLDIRLPIVGRAVDFIYLKRRPVGDRFSNTNRFVTVEPCERFLSPAELGLVEEFCRRIGLDYGELDCVRDKMSGRLYILDVNKTPAGPPNGLPKAGQEFALERMAVAFARNIVLRPARAAASAAAN